MTARIAILGSQASGICTGHHSPQSWTGVLSETPGNPANTAGGTQLALIGSSGTATCGHTFVVVDGSTIWQVNGVGIAVVGSNCPTTAGGTGVITTGWDYGTVV